jgi:hypothetical protein
VDGAPVIGEAGRADAGAFLARLVRMDPAAVVRLRPGGAGVAEMWAMLPFGVLVVRTLPSELDVDTTVGARALLEMLDDDRVAPPPRRDEAWRWPLPPNQGRVVETIPGAEIARVAAAASRTLRTAAELGVAGRTVGERVLRDALLDYVPIVVTGPDGEQIDVSQRLVQGVVRMGFLGSPSAEDPAVPATNGETPVTVRLAGDWIGLAASYGSAWYTATSALRLS